MNIGLSFVNVWIFYIYSYTSIHGNGDVLSQLPTPEDPAVPKQLLDKLSKGPVDVKQI